MKDTEKTLYYLDELPDYKVATDDCDVRGWMVADNTGRTVGLVDSLLVDKEAERVVYLGVEVSKDVMAHNNPIEDRLMAEGGLYAFRSNDGDNHLMVPAGLVELDKESERVLMPKINFKTFAAAGRFTRGKPIGREYEFHILRHFLCETVVDASVGGDGSTYPSREFPAGLTRREQ